MTKRPRIKQTHRRQGRRSERHLKTRLALAVSIVVVAAVLGYFLYYSLVEPSSNQPKVPTQVATASDSSNKAPGFTLTTIDGRMFTLNDLKGRIALLWFNAAWCPSCGPQAEALKKLESNYVDRVTIVAIDLWVPQIIGGQSAGGIPADTPEILKEFRARWGSKSWFWAFDTDRVTIRYGITTVDSTVIISPEGAIVYRHLGPTGFEPLDNVVKRLV